MVDLHPISVGKPFQKESNLIMCKEAQEFPNCKRCIKKANCTRDELRRAQHYINRYTRTTTRVLKRMQHTKPPTLQQRKKHDTGGIELQWCKHAGNAGGHHVMRRTVFFGIMMESLNVMHAHKKHHSF